MLKKIIISCCTALILSVATGADAAIEIFLSDVNIEDAKNQYGAGGSLAFNINADVRLLFRGSYTVSYGERTVWGTEYDLRFHHFTALAGMEYEPPFAFLSNNRLHWRNSILCGYSDTGIEVYNPVNSSAGDSGFAIAFNTGMGFDCTQHIQVFAETGWHYSFYTGELRDYDISGIQFFTGVRYAFEGDKQIYEEYW